ncbi:leucine-rich repeat domain-containing protein [Adlercreutzia sp. ZJ304]|uniref:leucine-rich repeat domain-containing protein n=1 Tax=Adlercreutzia sp. ZJ304 TaxID=2709791 RepID=UPI0013EB7AC3|nr:leucine-rich repeat domain-containing protein [Adlercreutzia sp. ZJ304]
MQTALQNFVCETATRTKPGASPKAVGLSKFPTKSVSAFLSLTLAVAMCPSAGLAYAAENGENQSSALAENASSANHVSEDVRLNAPSSAADKSTASLGGNESATAMPTEGTIESNGLVYAINAEDEAAVSLIGVTADIAAGIATGAATNVAADIATGTPESKPVPNKPALSIEIPEQVANGGKLYTVTEINVPNKPENCNPYTENLFSEENLAANVETITIPATVAQIDPTFFQLFPNAKAVNIAPNNATYASYDGAIYSADKTSLILVPQGKESMVLPESLTSVPACVLSRCTKLSVISFQGSTENDSFAVRNNCIYTADLTTIVAAPGVITSTESPVSPTIPVSPAKPQDSVNQQPTGEFAYTLLPDNTLSVGWTGEGMPAAISIPASAALDGTEYSVSAIADEGFANSENLVAISIPESVTTIGKHAFENCTNLNSIGISEGTTTIDEAAFKGTASTILVLPKSIQAIASGALANLNNTTIVAMGDVQDISPDALVGTTNTEIYTPYIESENYKWNIGTPVANNHLLPYGVKLSADVANLQVGDEANLYGEDGYLLTPGKSKATYSYGSAISIDTSTNTVICKQPGSSKVEVTITLPIDESAAAGVISGTAHLS